MPDSRAVETRFTAKDLMSSTFKKMGKGVDSFIHRTDKGFKKASRSVSAFKSTMGAILSANVLGKATALATRSIRGLGEEYISFDQAVTAAAAKFPEGIKRGTKEFKELQAVARAVGAGTKFSATEAAEGLNFLAMAGFSAKQSMAALPGLTDLATAGQLDLARASDIASDALGAFNLMSSDSIQLQKNLTRVNDVFARTVISANTDLELLFETMKQAGPVATSVGASLEDFAALAGAIAGAGIKGSMGGTTLKSALLGLAAATPQAKKQLKDLNINLMDADKNLRNPITLLGEFAKATEKMGTAQRTAAIKTVFGQRSIAGVSKLLALGGEWLEDYRDKLEKGGKSAKSVARDIELSLGNQLLALRSAAIEKGFQVIETAFGMDIPAAVTKSIKAVRDFDVKPITDSIIFVKDMIKWSYEHRDVLMSLAKGWLAYKVALKGVLALEAITGLMGIARATKAAGTAAGVAGGAGKMGKFLGAAGGIAAVAGIWTVAIDRMLTATEKLKNGYAEIIRMSTDMEQKTKNVKHLIDKNLKRIPGKIGGREPQRRIKSNIEFLEEASRAAAGVSGFEERERRERERQELGQTRIAPNVAEIEAKQTEVRIQQYIDVNAPADTKVKTRTEGAPEPDMIRMGLNF